MKNHLERSFGAGREDIAETRSSPFDAIETTMPASPTNLETRLVSSQDSTAQFSFFGTRIKEAIDMLKEIL